MTEKQTKAVATIAPQDQYLANVSIQDITEVFRDNLSGGQINPRDLPRIRIPAGGAVSWEVPSPTGMDSAKAIIGTVMHQKTMRAYWSRPFADSDGAPPDCTSQDGITGIGNPGGNCARCPLNQFGTADGGTKPGKACREVRAVFMLTKENSLPYFMPLSPMSIAPFRNYLMMLSQKGIPYWKVETSIALERDKNRDGLAYSKAIPSLSRLLVPDEVERMREYRAALQPAIDGVTLEGQDVYD